MFRNISAWHILVVVLAIVLLFGWKRLPDMARSLGQSMRVFKTEVDEMGNDRDRRKGEGAGSGDGAASATHSTPPQQAPGRSTSLDPDAPAPAPDADTPAGGSAPDRHRP